jgi:endonuclease/exonuclease/phosphatase family metal-dependent hydrolase
MRLLAFALPICLAACGERPLEPRDPTPGVPHYRVKTYNIETGKANDRPTVEAVGAGDPDIVCVQESNPDWEATLRERYAEQYPHQLYRENYPDIGAGDLGILSKFPVTNAGFLAGPNGWHPAWHVLVDTPAGRIQILNLHLRSGNSGNGNTLHSYLTTKDDHRYEIGLFMRDMVPQLPTLVVGDFNEGVDGAAVEYLEDRGFENALPLYHPGQYTWRHASVANQFDQTLDHILFDHSFAPLNAYVIRAGNSDHIAVVAHLEATGDWPSSPVSIERAAPRSGFESVIPN